MPDHATVSTKQEYTTYTRKRCIFVSEEVSFDGAGGLDVLRDLIQQECGNVFGIVPDGEFEVRSMNGKTLVKCRYEDGLEDGPWEFPYAKEGKYRGYDKGQLIASAETPQEMFDQVIFYSRNPILPSESEYARRQQDCTA